MTSTPTPASRPARRRPSQRELAGRQLSTLLYLPLLFTAVFVELPSGLAIALLIAAMVALVAGLRFGPKLMLNASKSTVQRSYLGSALALPLVFGILAGLLLPDANNGMRILFVALLAGLLAISYFSVRQFNKCEF